MPEISIPPNLIGHQIASLEKSTRITLIDTVRNRLQPLYLALKTQAYHPQLLTDIENATPQLLNTDLLIIDITVAKQPKSSKLINVPTIIVLTDNALDQLPPWLKARHIFLLAYPVIPASFIKLGF